MAIDSILDKVIEKAGEVTVKVSDLTDDIWSDEEKLIIDEFKDSGVEKVKDILSNLNNSGDLFDKSGFHLSVLNVALGIPPVISAGYIVKEKISSEERAKILFEAESNKIVKILISCLFKASDFYDKIQFGTYKLNSIEIKLGLIPGIALKFSN